MKSKDYVIQTPRLSILMPAYNEAPFIEKMIRKIDCVPLEDIGVKRELIIVDDGSQDQTGDIVRNLAKEYSYIHLIVHESNMGKGAAIKTAIKNATGQIMIVQDADLEYDPMDYSRCIMPILKGEAKVVYGSRRLEKSNKQYSGLSYYIGGIGITWIFNLLFFTHLTDEPTCYKTFRSDVIRQIRIRENRFDWEPEVTAKIIKQGIKIKEVPIHYYPRSADQGKKISWKDGLEAIWAMIKYRFVD